MHKLLLVTAACVAGLTLWAVSTARYPAPAPSQPAPAADVASEATEIVFEDGLVITAGAELASAE